MFKLTGKSGYRSSGSGGSGTPRVQGHTELTGRMPLHPSLPPFQSLDPRGHGYDSNSPRLSGLEK